MRNRLECAKEFEVGKSMEFPQFQFFFNFIWDLQHREMHVWENMVKVSYFIGQF